MRDPGVCQVRPDLVADDEQVVFLGYARDRCQLIGVEGTARGVVRVAQQDDAGGVVDRGRETLGIHSPAGSIERTLHDAPPSRRHGGEERMVHGREEHDPVARIGVQPQGGLDRLHHITEQPNLLGRPAASHDGAPATH